MTPAESRATIRYCNVMPVYIQYLRTSDVEVDCVIGFKRKKESRSSSKHRWLTKHDKMTPLLDRSGRVFIFYRFPSALYKSIALRNFKSYLHTSYTSRNRKNGTHFHNR
jgi:hypothetical protein